MTNLILNILTIYGLNNIPKTFNVGGKQIEPKLRPSTQIIDVIDLNLPMSQSHIVTWTLTETPVTEIIEPPSIVLTDPKYRVDCFPDPSK